eukprot:TRINITY_DN4306_c1_g2_i3.p1 TRINITY_DN4306_c1_g2~~TRINITY_DN4306_c1_g2_i3.p1  ORF type:complete len:515 (-),score=111.15 TRINITY_DN4306_c1_g2_i3:124-1668(-)
MEQNKPVLLKLLLSSPSYLPHVQRPSYKREGLVPSIVHFGVGGFHRSHMALYIDDLLQQGNREWSILGVGIKEPFDRWMREALESQDYLYTVIERDGSQVTARVVASITKYLFAPDSPETVLQEMCKPEVKIVSLTITEGGYYLDAKGDFPEDHADVIHDSSHPTTPVSAFGYIIEALRRRHEAGIPPFTVLSCDNVQGNGEVAHQATLGFAKAVEKHRNSSSSSSSSSFLNWLEKEVSFPNSMVDRITPQTTDADKVFVRELGIEDKWPVMTEPFRQWIIEDHFVKGTRPPFEKVGAQFVEDVSPYECMKLRLLNASHSALAYLGYLIGYRQVHESLGDPLFVRLLEKLMNDEVTESLPPVPGIDLTEYKKTLITRFANPPIKDQLSRICLHGASKMPKFILPSISAYLSKHTALPKALTLAVAAWLRFLDGKDEKGELIKIAEDPLDHLVVGLSTKPTASREGQQPKRQLPAKSRAIFGDLVDNEVFADGLLSLLERMRSTGVKKVMEEELS